MPFNNFDKRSVLSLFSIVLSFYAASSPCLLFIPRPHLSRSIFLLRNLPNNTQPQASCLSSAIYAPGMGSRKHPKIRWKLQVHHLSSPALLANISTMYSANKNLHKAVPAHQLLRQPSEAGKWKSNIQQFPATKGPYLKILGITLSETHHRSLRQRTLHPSPITEHSATQGCSH
ncbi:hypothetical protein NA56DRAFT_750601 [Hyaloscypha hepaticicola]|uniref:Uncharacterized protein n=1 Tax=Hyaloscypha hepaticicola TaxID=2082293 RepID=A0A2J6PZQ2_9HELO|nr:hypothetical protein NA56DRAFT_750601 [Hyaloscypha hepaticicola]